jgi:hypothetical protein
MWKPLLLILSLGIPAAAIPAAPASAASLKPHNALVFPMDAPMDVEVRFDDKALRYEAIPPAASAISPVGGILATARYRKMEEDIIRPAMAALNAGLSTTPRREMLTAIIRDALEATGKIRVGDVRVYDSAHPAPDADVEPDSPVLLVFLRYDMEPMMGGLSIHLGARHGPRGDVVAGVALARAGAEARFLRLRGRPRGVLDAARAAGGGRQDRCRPARCDRHAGLRTPAQTAIRADPGQAIPGGQRLCGEGDRARRSCLAARP